MFKRIITGSDRKLLSERGFSKISGNSGNNEIYGGVVSPENSFFYSNGLNLPFGQFKMKDDGSFVVKE